MKKHTLYFSKYCYFCQKVLFKIKGKSHQIELRSISEPEHLQELSQGGGKTQVPCLKIESLKTESLKADSNHKAAQATWMYESEDILQYIASNKLVS